MTSSTAASRDLREQTRVVGYATPAQVALYGSDDLDCDRPLLAVTTVYGARPDPLDFPRVWRCSNHRESKCRPCARRYRRRVQDTAQDGMHAPDGRFYLLTLTAPGMAQHCKRKGCSRAPHCPHEMCPCTPPDGVDLPRWNPTCGARWNVLLKLIERHYGVRPTYFRGVEIQDGKRREDNVGRGALHLHVLVRIDVVLTTAVLRRLAISAGFGHALVLDELAPGSKRAAVYVSKYVSKACDVRDEVPWLVETLDPETGKTHSKTDATYRTWSKSRAWGKAMHELRTIARRKWETTRENPPAGSAGSQQPLGREDPPPDD